MGEHRAGRAAVGRAHAGLGQACGQGRRIVHVERDVVDVRPVLVHVAEPARTLCAGGRRQWLHRLDRRLGDQVDRTVAVPMVGVATHHAQRREHAVEEQLGVGDGVDEGSQVKQLAETEALAGGVVCGVLLDRDHVRPFSASLRTGSACPPTERSVYRTVPGVEDT